MFIFKAILPEWVGDENGIIENLQLLWLIGGVLYCIKAHSYKYADWGGSSKALWKAGTIYFFLLIMREISWGRVFFTNPDGGMIQYSQMGLYGKLVHPLVGILIVTMLILLYQARIWRVLLITKLPVKSFTLLLLFIFFSWVGERTKFTGFHGQVAEELAEFGAYMMMYVLLKDVDSILRLFANKAQAVTSHELHYPADESRIA
ncbi:hypothetical protein [uncultured Phascolarctobacterium sp.]|uniref:hypothetical protein n=1 Tax=uncultured Phascolarctobacterium sp. TaxID=512296 RepID=UPI0025D6A18A|nr:hypothetical protein [uncultured Phascolarctobacterium sp.]